MQVCEDFCERGRVREEREQSLEGGDMFSLWWRRGREEEGAVVCLFGDDGLYGDPVGEPRMVACGARSR